MKQFLLTKKMLLQAGNNDDYDFHIDNNGGNVDVIDDDDVDYKELGRVPCKTPTQPSLHIVHDQLSDIGLFDLLMILSEVGRNVDKASYPRVPRPYFWIEWKNRNVSAGSWHGRCTRVSKILPSSAVQRGNRAIAHSLKKMCTSAAMQWMVNCIFV